MKSEQKLDTRSTFGPRTSELSIETAVLRTVAYADVFNYPLTTMQLHRYLEGVAASLAEVEAVLANGRLLPRKLSRREGYLTLPGREKLVAIRRRREAASRRLWPGAIRYGRLMAHLPFVRMVALTGSLAMNNVGRNVDIDYLVVTENGRLWLCRAFIILLVRMAQRGGVVLCPNYILTENALAFTDHNLYTAHEVTQMVPLSGLYIYRRMREENGWTAAFLPNAVGPPGNGRFFRAVPGAIQRVSEAPFRTALGRWLNEWEMDRKVRKFRGLETAVSETDFSPDYCKGHFDAYNHPTMTAYRRRLESIL